MSELLYTQKDLLSLDVIRRTLPLCNFPEAGTKVICAVSGGADSTALVVLAVAAGCDVTAIHVDHGLRPGSHMEANVVAKTAQVLNVKFESKTVHVGNGPNLEARARDARYEVLPDNVATGHTADDQAETVLLNLIRGTSLSGLRGMEVGERHPILGLRRSDTEAICEALHLEIVHDPTNDETVFRRNKIRHLVIPLLNEISEKDVVPLINRSADHVRDTHQQILRASQTHIGDPSCVEQMRNAPQVVAKQAMHKWLKENVKGNKMIDAATVERAMDVVSGKVKATQIPGGYTLRRTKGQLRLC